MRYPAALLLIIASVLDLLAGAGLFVIGLMGAEALIGLISLTDSLPREYASYASLVQEWVEHAVAEVLALEGRLEWAVAQVKAHGVSFDQAIAVAGALVVVTGFLAMAGAFTLIKWRGGAIVTIGCVAVFVVNAGSLFLLGLSYFQLPGFLGGLLGLLASVDRDVAVQSRPAAMPMTTKIAKPGGAAKPAAATPPPAEEPTTTSKVRPSVKTAEFQQVKRSRFKLRLPKLKLPKFKLRLPSLRLGRKEAKQERPKRKLALPSFKLPLRKIAAFVSVAAVLILGGFAAYQLYPRYFGPDSAKAPAPTVATAPAPAPTPAQESAREAPKPKPKPEPTFPSTPVEGQLDGKPFKPARVALKVDTDWTVLAGQTRVSARSIKSSGFDQLSLVLDAGKDFQIEIEGLPESYDFTRGLELRIVKGPMKSKKPKLTVRQPQRGNELPKVNHVYDRYELYLKLDPLRGNRIKGGISLKLPAYMRTQFGGTFRAWVDGHPDIEPDLTRGGAQSFKFIAFQYLKEIHPGSEITIKDDTYSHQVGDASNLLAGYIMMVYSVDGEEAATILRIETSEGYWRVLDSLDATYLAEAHPIEVPDPQNEGQWINYLAARHTEEWFREKHPGKYPWGVRFTGTSNFEVGYADIHLSLRPYGDPESIERRYYFLRRDGRWRYIRDLKDEEMVDDKTGKVVMRPVEQKPVAETPPSEKPVAETPPSEKPADKSPETVEKNNPNPATG
ncbi:MAG: hypothetical protein R3337_05695 [Gammaproteobacteria bacterium]|nr:hypothetical protein [Gammaproteobacteria bacterium]